MSGRLLGISLAFILVLAAALLAACGEDQADESGSNGDDVIDDDDDNDADDDDDVSDDDDAEGPPADSGDRFDFPYMDPAEAGPYPVGHRTVYWEDPDRPDAFGDPRRLVIELWYPAIDEARDMPQDKIIDFLAPYQDLARSIFEGQVPPEEMENLEQPCGAVRDAPLRSDSPRMPVVLFSHGNAGVRWQNFTMCNHLASHGYLVVAPDHTGNALMAPFPDKLILFDPLEMPASFGHRKQDLSFILTEIEKMDDDPDSFAFGRINPTQAGLIGHSFGGTAVVETTKGDLRFEAAMDLCSFTMPGFPDDYRAAVFFWWSTEDNTMDDWEQLTRVAYDVLPTPKVFLEVFLGGHYTPTDACALIPSMMGDGDGCGSGERHSNGEPFDYLPIEDARFLLHTYAAAFMGVYVKGDERYVGDLITEQMPDELALMFDLR